MEKKQSIKIDLTHIEDGLHLYIDTKHKGDIEVDTTNFYEHEATYQLKEGCYYDFEFSDNTNPENYRLICSDQTNIVQSRKRKEHIGIIAPNIFVGTLTLQIFSIENPEKKMEFKIRGPI